ncbi:30S ribosomal protein S1 [Niallia circulans]|uniref:30S ribosomal protein S1 n=1 Tax=Niallia circulans TaxID=1397 RepID=A0A553SL58_NIACI|nr:30S ribosomal protein S1 [Niallia circulans]TRZ37722.1 30S ribosomal protein S1 [Niallia circulans]
MSEELNDIVVHNYTVGDRVSGKVTKVEEKQVIVAITDSKLDGIIPISELSSLHIEKAEDVVSEGEKLDLQVIKVEEDALVLSKRKVDAEKAWESLEERFNSGEIFDAEVKDVVKGGLVVDLGVRGFVPASLVEAHYVEDFSDYKGKTISFKIVELEKDKNRLILSHKAVVEEEKSKQKQNVLESLQEGQTLQGVVQRITDFGAFVDLGGIDGLVHISQLSHEHITKPSDVVQEGQEVNVKILSVDRNNDRISLSIKDTLPGPWANIADKAEKGSVLEGTVKRIVSYGAFVEVFPGVEGLVHISQIAHKHIGTPHEVLKEGQTVQVKVLDVNEDEQRLSLNIKDLTEKEEENEVYELPEESKGFQLGDMIGEQLRKLKQQ